MRRFALLALLFASSCSVPRANETHDAYSADEQLRALVIEAFAELEVEPVAYGLKLRATPATAWNVDADRWSAAGFRLHEEPKPQMQVSFHSADEHDRIGEHNCEVYLLKRDRDLRYSSHCPAEVPLVALDGGLVTKAIHIDADYYPISTRHYFEYDYCQWHPLAQDFVSDRDFDWLEALPELADSPRPLLVVMTNLEASMAGEREAPNPADHAVLAFVSDAVAKLEIEPSDYSTLLHASPAASWNVNAQRWAEAGFKINQRSTSQLSVSIHAASDHEVGGVPTCIPFESGLVDESVASYCLEINGANMSQFSGSAGALLSDDFEVLTSYHSQFGCYRRQPGLQPTQINESKLASVVQEYMASDLPALAGSSIYVDDISGTRWNGALYPEGFASQHTWLSEARGFVPPLEFRWHSALTELGHPPRPLAVISIDLDGLFVGPNKLTVGWSDGDDLQRYFRMTLQIEDDQAEVARGEEIELKPGGKEPVNVRPSLFQ